VDRAGGDHQASRSRCTGATNRSSTGVSGAALASKTPVPTAPAAGSGRPELTRLTTVPRALFSAVSTPPKLTRVLTAPSRFAQQLGVAALRREGHGDRVTLDLQAEQVEVERLELDLQQLLRGLRRAGQGAAVGAGRSNSGCPRRGRSAAPAGRRTRPGWPGWRRCTAGCPGICPSPVTADRWASMSLVVTTRPSRFTSTGGAVRPATQS